MSLTLDNKKRLEVIEEKVDSVQRNLDLHIADTEKEIGDVQQLRVQVATLIETVNGLEKTINRQTDKIKTKVEDAIQPIMDEAQNLQDAIKSKTILKTKETFWGWFKKYFGGR